jgi:hypothetical protein
MAVFISFNTLSDIILFTSSSIFILKFFSKYISNLSIVSKGIPVADADLNDTGKDNVGNETQFVAVADVKNMDPCIFNDKKNPADPSLTCTETFTARMDAKNRGGDSSSSDDEDFTGIFGNMFSTHSTHNKKKSGCNLASYKRVGCNKKKRRNKTNSPMKAFNVMDDFSKLPDDVYVKAFYIFMTGFSLYVFYRFMKRISNAR